MTITTALPGNMSDRNGKSARAPISAERPQLGARSAAARPRCIEALQARSDPAERAALWDKARAAAAAAEASCGNAAETAAAGMLLLNAVRVSALGQDFDEAYAGLEAFPAKNSKAYANAVLALGKYLVGEGMLEEGRRYRDRLLTPEFLAGLEASDKDIAGQLMMWLAEDDAHWSAALATQSRKTDLAVMNFLPAKQLRALSQDEQTFSAGRARLAGARGLDAASMRAAVCRKPSSPKSCSRLIRS